MLRRLRLTGAEIALVLVLVLVLVGVGGAATGLFKASRIAVGNTSQATGLVNLESGTTAARGLYFGSDCVIYRSAASQLKLANSMYVTGDTILGDTAADSTTIAGNTTVGGTLGVTGASTVTGTLGLGASPGTTGALNLTTATANTGGIYLGDANLYRTGTTALRTNSALTVDGATTLSGALNSNGATTLGDASTDTITCTGRLILRTCGSDPLHATPGSRPAGSVGEIALFGDRVYLCTNASTPTWIVVGPPTG